MNKHFVKKIGLGAAAAISAGQAAAYDWTAVTAGVDFAGELTAVAAIVGLLAAVYVTIKGGRIVLSLLK